MLIRISIHQITKEDLRCVTNRKPTEEEIEQLLFAWKVVKHVKSNAIVLVKDNMTIGVGAGQMNRVGSAKIAIEQAGGKSKRFCYGIRCFLPNARHCRRKTIKQALLRLFSQVVLLKISCLLMYVTNMALPWYIQE